MSETQTRDLLHGSVPKQLIIFALPFLAANVLQSVYSVVDMIIVGQFVGSAGLSGVSIGSQITGLFTTAGMGLATGGQIMLAQFKGAGDEKAQKETIGTTLSFMVLLGIVLAIPSILLARPLLNVLNTPAEAYEEAWRYFVICCVGIVFIFGYNAVCSVLRGLGDSRRPMYFVAFSTVLNILLDLLFVGVLQWGAGGAAAATILSQAASFAVALGYLYKHKAGFVFDFKPRSFRIVGGRLLTLLKVGIPFTLQFSMINISMLVVVRLVNDFGVAASAGYGVGGKVEQFASMPMYALASAAATMVGQNIGAGQQDRAKSVVHWCVLINLITEIVLIIFIQFFASQLISIFNGEPEVIEMGVRYIRIMCFAFIAHCFLDSYLAMSNGVGFSILAFICCSIDALLVRIPLAILFSQVVGLGYEGIVLGSMIAPFVAGTLAGIYFYSGRWRKRSLVGKEQSA